MKIVCTYKTGGDFNSDYVISLYDSLSKYDIEFWCLTDAPNLPSYINQKQIIHGWTGWWSKIEMLGVFEDDLLCFDLDTVILDDIQEMIDYCLYNNDKIIMLSDFYYPDKAASGIMYVPKYLGMSLYKCFCYQSEYFMGVLRGDQDFINFILWDKDILRWEDVLDKDYICSYKAHVIKQYPGTVHPKDIDHTKSKIICFHGRPRPTKLIREQLKNDLSK